MRSPLALHRFIINLKDQKKTGKGQLDKYTNSQSTTYSRGTVLKLIQLNKNLLLEICVMLHRLIFFFCAAWLRLGEGCEHDNARE